MLSSGNLDGDLGQGFRHEEGGEVQEDHGPGRYNWFVEGPTLSYSVLSLSFVVS